MELVVVAIAMISCPIPSLTSCATCSPWIGFLALFIPLTSPTSSPLIAISLLS